MQSKINPFGKQEVTVKPATQVLQENFGIGIRNYDRGADRFDPNRKDDKGQPAPGWVHVPEETLECVIEFSVNEGKGTGRQAIPANEFLEYVDALQAIIDSDYAEPEGPDRTEYIPTHQVVSQSFKMTRPRVKGPDGKTTVDQDADRTVVSVRCTGGKGSKPMLIDQSEFPQVVQMLRGIADNLDSYEANAWDRYEAEQAAKEAEAASAGSTGSDE